MSDQEYEAYLDLFKISEGKYIIGIYQDGITVYKQQLRALNIFAALVGTKKIEIGGNFSVAIIGGGVAGLTFAAAALKSNIPVTIFEKQPNYLHMQHGCDTRTIHPNIYDWPDPGSLFPNAKLPVLSWTYDTASNVTKQILKGFDEIRQEIKNSDNINALDLLKEYPNCEITEIIDDIDKPEKFRIKHKRKGNELVCYCNLIIYAVGYGVEQELKVANNTPSYWRNDAYSQSVLKEQDKRFLISGVGDGGLMDLFRLKIRDFSYDTFLDILKSKPKKFEILVKRLADIKKKGQEQETPNSSFYYDQFDRMAEEYYDYIHQEWKEQNLIRDNHVILHCRKPFSETLNLKKISLLNAFIGYLMKHYTLMEVMEGQISFDEDIKQYTVNNVPIGEVQPAIIRHGTDRKQITETLFLSQTEKEHLKVLADKQKKYIPGENQWTFSLIHSYFNQSSLNVENAVVQSTKHKEYLTADTTSMCRQFVISLAKILEKYHKDQKNFRVSLHRVMKLDNDFYYQQITPYSGSKAVTNKGGLQNVNKIRHGNVGLSVKSGRSILIVNHDEANFLAVKDALKLTKAYDNEKDPKSFLTIPVLAKLKNPGKRGTNFATNLVVYIDSEEKDFFDKEEIIDLIMCSINGFIEYINTMLEHQQITMGEAEFDPLPITNICSDTCPDNECFVDYSSINEKLLPEKSALHFKNFYSFDIIYNK